MLKLHLQVVQLIGQALQCGKRRLNRGGLFGTGINRRLYDENISARETALTVRAGGITRDVGYASSLPDLQLVLASQKNTGVSHILILRSKEFIPDAELGGYGASYGIRDALDHGVDLLVSWPVKSIGVQEGVNLLLESGPERVIARAHGIIRRVVLFKERDHDTGHPNAPRPIVQVDL